MKHIDRRQIRRYFTTVKKSPVNEQAPPDLAHARAGKENRKDNLQGSCPFQQYQHRNHER